MALGASHRCMFPLFEIPDYFLMAIRAFKYHRMVFSLLVALFRTLFMTIVAFINGWVDSGFTHRFKQKQGLVGIMTFHTSYGIIDDVKKFVVFLGIYLSKVMGTGVELAVTIKASLESVFFGHWNHFFWNGF